MFVPALYLDGIEAIEYPWIGDTILQDKFVKKVWLDLSHHKTDVSLDKQDIEFNESHAFDYIPNKLGRYYDIDAKEIKQGYTYNHEKKTRTITDADEWIYGPAWAVQYHLNPASAIATYEANKPDFNVLEPDVVYYNTRAAAAKLKVSSPEKFNAQQTLQKVTNTSYNDKFYGNYGNMLSLEYGVQGLWSAKTGKFANKEGILTAGIQIERPDLLAPWPTDDTINPNGNTNSDVSYPAASNAAGEAHPEWYGFAKYKYDKNNTDNTVALQLQNSEASTITSDYALLVPTRVQLEGLIWYKEPQYIEPDMDAKRDELKYGPNKRTAHARYGDEEGWAVDEYNNCYEARVHVWDSPEEALADPDGAALELNCIGEGVDLTKYLGIHFVKENLKKKETAPSVLNSLNYDLGTWAYGDEAAFGLHYEFQFVDYYSSSNKTHDSRYATFSDIPATDNAAKNQKISKTGIVVAKSVDHEQNTIDEQSTSSRDREPLVRVMVKNAAGKVLLDGYILLHIDYTPDNLAITTYPAHKYEFDLCNPTKMQTTWAQFSKLILQDKTALDGMEKLSFDDFYWADCKNGGPTVPADDEKYVTTNAFQVVVEGASDSHNRGYQLQIYNFGDLYGMKDGAVAMPPKAGTANPETALAGFQNKELGNAVYYPNGEGVTNHIFSWSLSEEEIEYLTHDNATTPVKVYRWIRFIAKDQHRNREVDTYNAPYPYVWIKMEMELTRANNDVAYELKDENYWYHWNTGEYANKWSAIVWDIQAPRNGNLIDRFNRNIPSTLVGNKLTFDKTVAGYKYYFAPKEETVKFYMTTRSKDAATRMVDANPVSDITSQLKDKTVKSVVEGFDQLPEAVQKKLKDAGLVTEETRVITALNTDKYNVATKKAETTKLYTSSVSDYVEGDRYQIYDQMLCKYVWPHGYVNLNEPQYTSGAVTYSPANVTISKAQDKHLWVENDLKDVLNKCAIDYNKGVFANKFLYSFNPKTKEYILIAKLNQVTGEIELIKDDPKAFEEAKLVLNAYGYEPAHENIYKELRTWVGVVAKNGCEVAKYTAPKQTDDNLNTFLVSWQRPINTNAEPISPKLDANTNENFIHLIDYLKLYDWRGNEAGTNQGYMYNDHYWFWAYYKIKSISLDMDRSRVYTNLHYGAEDFRPIGTISSRVDLTAYSTGFGNTNTGLSIYHFDLDSYNRDDREAALELFMGYPSLTNPSTKFNNTKQRFGVIYYQNNGDNVTNFDVIVPITIEYEWGWLTRFAQFNIQDTHGNH